MPTECNRRDNTATQNARKTCLIPGTSHISCCCPSPNRTKNTNSLRGYSHIKGTIEYTVTIINIFFLSNVSIRTTTTLPQRETNASATGIVASAAALFQHDINKTPHYRDGSGFINVTTPAVPPFNAVSSREQMCTFQQWTQLPNQPGVFRIFTIISVLTILVILVVLGNALVIAAVILRRRLRSATGLLILSLAVADLMVGLVILPFSIANEVLNSYWIFGDAWCTAWLTMDIWMCTASIYNLVAISIDRYIAIIKPLNYPMLITKFRARCIVAAVWIGSFIICSPSFLLASTERNTAKDASEMTNGCRCTPSNSGMAYIVFSASSSFYIPMIIVIFVYVRIYIAACAATKSVYSGMMQVTATANKNPKNILMQNPSALSRADNVPMLRVHRRSTIKNSSGDHPFEVSSGTIKSQILCKSPTQNSAGSAHQSPRDSPAMPLRDYITDNDDSPQSPPSLGQMARPLSETTINERDKQWYYKNKNTAIVKHNRHRSHSREKYQRQVLQSPLSLDMTNGENQRISKSRTTKSEDFDLKTSSAYYDSNAPDDPLNEKVIIDANTYETTSFLPSTYIGQGYTNRVTGISETSSSTSYGESNNNCADKGDDATRPVENGGETTNGMLVTTKYLHPNSAKSTPVKKKKRNYGATVLNRLIRRGPHKKAGCAYEKHLSLEIKAAKTVAIVTGCFIFCWLGFSILYGLSFAIHSNEVVWSVVFWLGYLNSALNPVIYTVFNREFRTCFKRLLTCNHTIFASRFTNQTTMYNSYNSQMRNGQGKGCYSSVSAPPYCGTRSSPPDVGNNSTDS